jgi:hypothetical protein
MSKGLRAHIELLDEDDVLKVSTIKRLLDSAPDGGPEEVTTAWCSDHLGRSQEWWSAQCRDGLIADAYQRTERGAWYLPQAAARSHLLRIRNRSRTPSRGEFRRGPRSRAS